MHRLHPFAIVLHTSPCFFLNFTADTILYEATRFMRKASRNMNGSGMGKNRNGYALSQTFFVTTFSFSRYFLTSEKNTKTLWQALRTSTKHAELFWKQTHVYVKTSRTVLSSVHNFKIEAFPSFFTRPSVARLVHSSNRNLGVPKASKLLCQKFRVAETSKLHWTTLPSIRSHKFPQFWAWCSMEVCIMPAERLTDLLENSLTLTVWLSLGHLKAVSAWSVGNTVRFALDSGVRIVHGFIRSSSDIFC